MFRQIAQRPRSRVEDQSITIKGFPRGLNSYEAHRAVRKDELTSALNYYLNRRGDLVPRPGLVRFTTTALDGNAVQSDKLKIGSDYYDLVCTSTNKVYSISSSGVPTLLGTTEGKAHPFTYSDYCLICDGSNLKIVGPDGVLRLAYDAGEDNGLYDKIDETADTEILLHASQSRVGVLYTTPAWDAGWKIPLTDARAVVKRTGSPTGTIVAKLYRTTTEYVVSNESYDAASILTTNQTLFFTFPIDPTDQTGWMTQATAYRVVLELVSGTGDASNYIGLQAITDADLQGTRYTTGWANNEASPLMWLAPSPPPKASFGKTALNRPFISGGPDDPGLVWYGNVSPFDWSTPDGGGWIGVIDESETSYPVGGFGVLYGELYVFGTEQQPYLSKLTGDNPLAYTLLDSFKAIAAKHRTIVDLPNDIWYSRPTGSNNITGVDSYGSTRTYSQAASVIDTFDFHWNNDGDNIAGYYDKQRLYLLQISDSETVLVCHTNLPYQRSDVTDDIGHPWTEFKFPSIPTMLDSGKSDFLIGLSDGHVYKFDIDAMDDEGTEIEFNWRTAFIDIPFFNVELNTLHVLGASQGGLSTTVNIYTEANYIDIVQSLEVNLGQIGLLVVEATMLVQDAVFPVQRGSWPPIFPLNIHCSTVQLEGEGLTRYMAEPGVISGGLLKYKVLET